MAQKTKSDFSSGGFFGGFYWRGFLGGSTQKTHRVFWGMYPGVWTLIPFHNGLGLLNIGM